MHLRQLRLTGSPLTRGHASRRWHSCAGKRRRPAIGTSRLPSAPAPTTRTLHPSPARRPDALEITTPQARGRSAEQSSPTPRRSSGSAGGRSAGGAPSGGRLSREGLWTVSLRAPFIKGAPLATRGPEFYARSSPRGGSSHFPSDSPINPGRHGEAAPTQIQSVHPHSRTGRQLRAPADPGNSRIATRAGYSSQRGNQPGQHFSGPVISGQHQDQIDSDLEWQSHSRPGLPGAGLVKSRSPGYPQSTNQPPVPGPQGQISEPKGPGGPVPF